MCSERFALVQWGLETCEAPILRLDTELFDLRPRPIPTRASSFWLFRSELSVPILPAPRLPQ
eukprot:3778370-Alexandrium_andersonii.AAC.1